VKLEASVCVCVCVCVVPVEHYRARVDATRNERQNNTDAPSQTPSQTQLQVHRNHKDGDAQHLRKIDRRSRCRPNGRANAKRKRIGTTLRRGVNKTVAYRNFLSSTRDAKIQRQRRTATVKLIRIRPPDGRVDKETQPGVAKDMENQG